MAEQIRAFFAVNHMIIFFVYGEAFFVLGLAIALQLWKHSRLPLTRTLPWLAAFGFTHGFHEWGHLFIAIQATYVPPSVVHFLVILRAFLVALSFVFLFQFGIETLRPLPEKIRLVRYLPLSLFIVWIWYGSVLTRTLDDPSKWYINVSDIARYTLGFPGAAIASYGLYHQSQDLKQRVRLPRSIARSFTLAALSLLGYALIGGLVVPSADFFPADTLNTQLIYNVTSVPVEIWRSVLGLALAVAVIRALELFHLEIERRLTEMEEQQVMLAERERIGRELHDITLQSIYAAGLLLRTAERNVQQTQVDVALEQIHHSIRLLDDTITSIRQYIGHLQAPSTFHSLKAGLLELIQQSLIESLLDVETAIDVPDDRTLTPDQIRHLLAIINEALSNVVRHAHAQHVLIRATASEHYLCLQIQDDGQGIVPDYVVGYGLRNMQERVRMLGGQLTLTSQPGHGTAVKVEIPWMEDHDIHTTSAG